MSWLHPTLADALRRPAPYSFWRARLQRRAGSRNLQGWLVEQANLRGCFGAYNRDEPSGPADSELGLEEIVVALCAPQAPAEGRIFKLVLRIIQSGKLDLKHLVWLARRELAAPVLWWLLERVPEPERTQPVTDLMKAFGGPPRGYRGLEYDYDPQRLIRRPAGRVRSGEHREHDPDGARPSPERAHSHTAHGRGRSHPWLRAGARYRGRGSAGRSAPILAEVFAANRQKVERILDEP